MNGEVTTSYDLITDELVKQALANDVGPKAKLVSWETKDFTNKGDNYSSKVTSVWVKFEHDGKHDERSYVCKLNPLRDASAMTEIMDSMYDREVIVLSEVANGMNAQLKQLNQPPIKTPKLFASNLEKRRQMFMTEDLRKQNFKMYDRKKGMDISHALLVVEELGRFHASSQLFEETLPKKSIPQTFNQFDEPWMGEDHPGFKMFNTMISGQCKNASQLLSRVPKYEQCVAWINENIGKTGKIFVDSLTSTKPFAVLCHGDCWTNNMLFRYDELGNPTDLRFVDLQSARTTSPACDLNYFLYSSLNGVTRKENLHLLKVTYYLSFLKILLMAGQESPFTFHEFNEEMEKRMIVGLFTGMFILPIIAAEGENEIMDLSFLHEDRMDEYIKHQEEKFFLVTQRGGAFNDRFLSLFDEMLEANIFN